MFTRMNRMLRDGSGFTLVELLVPVIIVGILAVVVFRVCRTTPAEHQEKAEAEAREILIRIHERLNHCRYAYASPEFPRYEEEAVPLSEMVCFDNFDLSGRYVGPDDFTYQGRAFEYEVKVTVGSGKEDAPGAYRVQRFSMMINQNKEITGPDE